MRKPLSFYSLRVFHTRIWWWSFTGDWMRTSLLETLGIRRSQQGCNLNDLDSFSNFHFSSPFSNPSWIVPSIPSTIGITVTLTFHSLFISVARFKYSSIFFNFLKFLFSDSPEQQNALDIKFFLLFFFVN